MKKNLNLTGILAMVLATIFTPVGSFVWAAAGTPGSTGGVGESACMGAAADDVAVPPGPGVGAPDDAQSAEERPAPESSSPGERAPGDVAQPAGPVSPAFRGVRSDEDSPAQKVPEGNAASGEEAVEAVPAFPPTSSATVEDLQLEVVSVAREIVALVWQITGFKSRGLTTSKIDEEMARVESQIRLSERRIKRREESLGEMAEDDTRRAILEGEIRALQGQIAERELELASLEWERCVETSCGNLTFRVRKVVDNKAGQDDALQLARLEQRKRDIVQELAFRGERTTPMSGSGASEGETDGGVTGVEPAQKRARPWAAVLLSVLVSGGGQFYNGEPGKGVVFLGAALTGAAVSLVGFSNTDPNTYVAGILVSGLANIISVVDADVVASGRKKASGAQVDLYWKDFYARIEAQGDRRSNRFVYGPASPVLLYFPQVSSDCQPSVSTDDL